MMPCSAHASAHAWVMAEHVLLEPEADKLAQPDIVGRTWYNKAEWAVWGGTGGSSILPNLQY